jgi:FHS family L-fucose permease-like MFS transporter
VSAQSEVDAKPSSRAALLPFILIVSLFAFWGLANGFNGILVKQFRKAFTLDYGEAILVDTAFYIAYFVFAIPAGLFIRRFGYKAAVVFGLLLYASGAILFYPAAMLREYGVFLAALFVIASGLAFLETSANPLVTLLGPPETAARRLNFAQSFNAFGPISAVLIGRSFILSNREFTPAQLAAMPAADATQYYAAEAHAVQIPYLVLGLVVLAWALLVASVKFPAIATEPEPARAPASGLLAKPHFLFGVVAQFFYVGAQAGTWGLIIAYAQRAVPGMSERTAAYYLLASFIGFATGRFAGTALMGRIDANRLLALFAAINVVLALLAAFVGGPLGLYALAATSFFMSIMFPTIFASSVQGLGRLTKIASSFLIMAIIGGALLPLAMGRIADLSGLAHAMLVPAFCYAVILTFALRSRADG